MKYGALTQAVDVRGPNPVPGEVAQGTARGIRAILVRVQGAPLVAVAGKSCCPPIVGAGEYAIAGPRV